MCGLVGVSGNLYKKDVDAFNDMLFCDTLRGHDSTGVASVTLTKQIDVIKNIGPAIDLMGFKQYDNVVTSHKRLLIGHNRSATVGARNKRNAHPFEFDHVVGAHNGTLENKHALEEHVKFDTDSEAIFNLINKYGPEEVIPKLRGAWALTFYDKRTHTINMIRNDKRPLHYVFNKDKNVLYWSSEFGLLAWIMNRRGIEIDKYFQLPENMLYSWEIPNGQEAFGDPKIIGLEGAKDGPQNFPHEHWLRGYRAGSNTYNGSSQSESGKPYGHNSGSSNSRNEDKPDESKKTLNAPFTREELIALMEKLGPEETFTDSEALLKLPLSFDSQKDGWWAMLDTDTLMGWTLRILNMLKLGWDYGEKGADPVMAPPKPIKKADPTNVIPLPNRSSVNQPITYTQDKKGVWNYPRKLVQKTPKNPDKSKLFWSPLNTLWVFTKEDMDHRFTADEIDLFISDPDEYYDLVNQATEIKSPTQSAVKDLLDDWDRFKTIQSRIDSNKTVSLKDRIWYNKYSKELGEEDKKKLSEHPLDAPWVTDDDDDEKVASLLSYRHPNTRQFLSRIEFDEIAQHGCDWCNGDIEWGDKCKFSMYDLGNIEIFCEQCVTSDAHLRQYLRINS